MLYKARNISRKLCLSRHTKRAAIRSGAPSNSRARRETARLATTRCRSRDPSRPKGVGTKPGCRSDRSGVVNGNAQTQLLKGRSASGLLNACASCEADAHYGCRRRQNDRTRSRIHLPPRLRTHIRTTSTHGPVLAHSDARQTSTPAYRPTLLRAYL